MAVNPSTGRKTTIKDFATTNQTYTFTPSSVGTKQFTVYVKDAKGGIVATNTITLTIVK